MGEIHPYNAAQVMRIGGHLDLQSPPKPGGRRFVRWDWAEWRSSRLPLPPRIDQWRIGLLSGSSIGRREKLEAHLSAELNRRFDDPAEPPFRPFLLQRASDFYFGMVYQHWVADSVSIPRGSAGMVHPYFRFVGR